jgi:NAD(P)-dependent dehydrogenase (short-subunit alcohol dehydrogenase family)
MSHLIGRVALITGSTRGIGLAVARELADRNAHVIVTARSGEDVERAVRELEVRGEGDAFGVTCDVRDLEDCQDLVQQTVARFGGLDLLVNNAGIGRFAPIQEMSPEDWTLQIETNLTGVFNCSLAAIPHLKESEDGWIINIGSLAGRNPFAGGAAYNATKFGLLGMTEAMMLDLRYEGIRVSLIMPGSVNTEFGGREPGEEGAWRLQSEDVARAVVDLLGYPGNALPSRVELRPTQPPRK